MTNDENELLREALEQGKLLVSRMDSLVQVVERHEKTLYGTDGNFGLAQKIGVMWKSWTWVLCTLSSLATVIAMKAFKL